ncbi:Rieske (2Fe-2S) protein [candidate division KSB1 bacterium]
MAESRKKLTLFHRVFGICATKGPQDPECWNYTDGQIEIELERAPELTPENGAVRLEGKSLPEQVLVFRDNDGGFRALHNKCTHGGRRIDPLPGTHTVQCCSVGKSVFDYEGKPVSGSAKEPVKVYEAVEVDNKLVVKIT